MVLRPLSASGATGLNTANVAASGHGGVPVAVIARKPTLTPPANDVLRTFRQHLATASPSAEPTASAVTSRPSAYSRRSSIATASECAAATTDAMGSAMPTRSAKSHGDSNGCGGINDASPAQHSSRDPAC